MTPLLSLCPCRLPVGWFFDYISQVDIEVEVLSDNGGEFRFRGPHLKVKRGWQGVG